MSGGLLEAFLAVREREQGLAFAGRGPCPTASVKANLLWECAFRFNGLRNVVGTHRLRVLTVVGHQSSPGGSLQL